MPPPTKKRCKVCIQQRIGTNRPAPYPGPRCTTHHREFEKEKRARRRAAHVERTYGITEEQYQALYAAQGGACAICRRARGTGRKRLAVDHDHGCCSGEISCGRCVRMLACTTCNRMLGHARDDVEFFKRAIDCLLNPPARRVLGNGNLLD